MMEQATTLAVRDGAWKYIEPHDGQAYLANVNIETGLSAKPQLYNLAADLGETRNLASQQPERVRRMRETLIRIVTHGASKPAPAG